MKRKRAQLLLHRRLKRKRKAPSETAERLENSSQKSLVRVSGSLHREPGACRAETSVKIGRTAQPSGPADFLRIRLPCWQMFLLEFHRARHSEVRRGISAGHGKHDGD
jgi:hypothetical protein